jgi:hypothetical protein
MQRRRLSYIRPISIRRAFGKAASGSSGTLLLSERLPLWSESPHRHCLGDCQPPQQQRIAAWSIPEVGAAEIPTNQPAMWPHRRFEMPEALRTTSRLRGTGQLGTASPPPAGRMPPHRAAISRVSTTPTRGESYEPLPLFDRGCSPATASVIQRLHSRQLSV